MRLQKLKEWVACHIEARAPTSQASEGEIELRHGSWLHRAVPRQATGPEMGEITSMFIQNDASGSFAVLKKIKGLLLTDPRS